MNAFPRACPQIAAAAERRSGRPLADEGALAPLFHYRRTSPRSLTIPFSQGQRKINWKRAPPPAIGTIFHEEERVEEERVEEERRPSQTKRLLMAIMWRVPTQLKLRTRSKVWGGGGTRAAKARPITEHKLISNFYIFLESVLGR